MIILERQIHYTWKKDKHIFGFNLKDWWTYEEWGDMYHITVNANQYDENTIVKFAKSITAINGVEYNIHCSCDWHYNEGIWFGLLNRANIYHEPGSKEAVKEITKKFQGWTKGNFKKNIPSYRKIS